jgi:predicted RNase H-like HicB family nuclease
MKYPLKFPFSQLFAKFGATLTINIDCIFDDEAGVFVATSHDIPGLILETDNFVELKKEIEEAIPNLLNFNETKIIPMYRQKSTTNLKNKQRIPKISKGLFVVCLSDSLYSILKEISRIRSESGFAR